MNSIKQSDNELSLQDVTSFFSGLMQLEEVAEDEELADKIKVRPCNAAMHQSSER